MKNQFTRTWANAPVFLLAMVAWSSHANATGSLNINQTNTIRYQHTPLFIHLKPDTERWVSFPGRVQVDARGSGLTQSQLRLINNHGTLYFTAYQAFSQRRLLVHTPSRTVLMDIQADEQGDNTPVNVVFHRLHPRHPHQAKPSRHPLHRTASLIALMRAGIYAVYQPNQSPSWLKKKRGSLPLSFARPWLKKLVTHPSSQLTVTQMRQWKTVQHPTVFITAITVKNKGNKTLPLSLNALTGKAKAASLYPVNGQLKPMASTTLFLLSQ